MMTKARVLTILCAGAALSAGGMLAARHLTPVAVSGAPAAAVTVTNADHPVAIELFTSQGCSSCPPADALLGKLAQRRDVVAITRPVTYWDRLGWKDTLAREGNTSLQRAYAGMKHAGAGVYTPQLVVGGGDAAVGSDARRIDGLIASAGRAANVTLRVASNAQGRLLRLEGTSGGRAHVTLVALRSRADVRIGNGENGGRVVSYINVLVGETALGAWQGGTATIAVPTDKMQVRGADRYAVIVQRDGNGPILAARYL